MIMERRRLNRRLSGAVGAMVWSWDDLSCVELSCTIEGVYKQLRSSLEIEWGEKNDVLS